MPATGEWSKPVNGVQARLSVENWRDPMIAVFLELKNNKNLVNTITVPIQAEKIQFESRGPDGKLIPDAGLPRSGPVVVLQDFRLPFESTLRFNLSVSTVGVPGNAAAMIPLRSHAWHGRLQIPPVTVRLSAEERRPDREISWKYQVSPAARNSRLETLNALFEGESDVTCRTSTRPNEIEVTASQSRQLFVRDLVDALENGSSTQAADSKRAWLRRYPFRNNQFTFVRVKYSSGDGRPRRGARWATDYPDAERGRSVRLAGWTSLDVDPDGRVLELTDPELPRYPFLYMAEPGALVLDDQEVVALRKYLTSGGFLMADDFWGEAEWRNLRTQLKRVLPDVEPIDLPLTHRLFHCVFDFREKPQVCSIAVALHGRARGVTWEREDGREPHYYGLIDRTSGRMMAVLCHNTDLGDGWERRDESAWYAEEFSEKRAYPMALNIIFHAMTQ